MPAKKSLSYQEMSQQLDTIMAQLQEENIDIEEAVKLYEQGTSLIKELEKQLRTAQNRVKKIKLQFEK